MSLAISTLQRAASVGCGFRHILRPGKPYPVLPDISLMWKVSVQKAIPEPGWLVNAANPSICEVKEGGSRIQDKPCLHSEVEATLGYLRSGLKRPRTKANPLFYKAS